MGLFPYLPPAPRLDNLFPRFTTDDLEGLILGVLLIVVALALLFFARPKRRIVVRLKGVTWRRNQFCRGWLITGDTGSGKTTSGINQLAHQVFKNEPTWGGLCIDEKGVYWETLSAMARHHGRQHALIHLQIRTDDAGSHWTPPHRFNLAGDRSIPSTTYAKFVVDTATSLGQGGDKGFFKSQAQTHIAVALELLFELSRPVTLQGAAELLSNEATLKQAQEDLAEPHESPRRLAIREHFANRFLKQPEEQLGGVRETIGNYLQYFLTPEIAEVFCTGESTFDFADIDQGKIICVTMPQKFQTERRYVNTFLKLLYYTPIRQVEVETSHRQPARPLGRRGAAVYDRQRRRHQRLQLCGCHSRGGCDNHRRRAVHYLIPPAPGQRQVEGAHVESSQPDYL